MSDLYYLQNFAALYADAARPERRGRDIVSAVERRITTLPEAEREDKLLAVDCFPMMKSTESAAPDMSLRNQR